MSIGIVHARASPLAVVVSPEAHRSGQRCFDVQSNHDRGDPGIPPGQQGSEPRRIRCIAVRLLEGVWHRCGWSSQISKPRRYRCMAVRLLEGVWHRGGWSSSLRPLLSFSSLSGHRRPRNPRGRTYSNAPCSGPNGEDLSPQEKPLQQSLQSSGLKPGTCTGKQSSPAKATRRPWFGETRSFSLRLLLSARRSQRATIALLAHMTADRSTGCTSSSCWRSIGKRGRSSGKQRSNAPFRTKAATTQRAWRRTLR